MMEWFYQSFPGYIPLATRNDSTTTLPKTNMTNGKSPLWIGGFHLQMVVFCIVMLVFKDLVIQSDLFGMVKSPFQMVKWPPTIGDEKVTLNHLGVVTLQPSAWFSFPVKRVGFFDRPKFQEIPAGCYSLECLGSKLRSEKQDGSPNRPTTTN